MSKHKPCIGDYVMAEYYKAELAKVKKQLAIAVEALEKSAEINKLYLKAKDGAEIELDVNGSMWSVAREALQKIKELENA